MSESSDSGLNLSSKPSICDLGRCSGLAETWYLLGIELKVEQEELDAIEDKYRDDHLRMVKMFGVWLRKGECPSYRKLVEALVAIRRRDIAEALCQQISKLNYLQVKVAGK